MPKGCEGASKYTYTGYHISCLTALLYSWLALCSVVQWFILAHMCVCDVLVLYLTIRGRTHTRIDYHKFYGHP